MIDAIHKPRIAFFDFTGCEGCQLTVIDALQLYPEILDMVEIVQFREASSEIGDNYQIAFIEGSCSRPEDEERLKIIRERAEVVVALGACAHLGGVNTLRNWLSQEHAHKYVYGKAAKPGPPYSPRPIDTVVKVDHYLPGCPIDRREFAQTVKLILQNRSLRLPDHPVCVECRLKENVCVFTMGQPCLGPITRAGCDAICPSYGLGCLGCRGILSDPNMGWLKLAFSQHGIDENTYNEMIKRFFSYQYNGWASADVV